MIFAAFLILAAICAALIIVSLLINRQTLIDRCGVEVITPEDLTGEKSEGPTPSKVRLSAETTRDSQRTLRTQAKPECALAIARESILTQLLASGALRKI